VDPGLLPSPHGAQGRAAPWAGRRGRREGPGLPHRLGVLPGLAHDADERSGPGLAHRPLAGFAVPPLRPPLFVAGVGQSADQIRTAYEKPVLALVHRKSSGSAPGADSPGSPLARGSVVPAAAVGADPAFGSGLQPPLPATGTPGQGPAALVGIEAEPATGPLAAGGDSPFPLAQKDLPPALGTRVGQHRGLEGSVGLFHPSDYRLHWASVSRAGTAWHEPGRPIGVGTSPGYWRKPCVFPGPQPPQPESGAPLVSQFSLSRIATGHRWMMRGGSRAC